MSFNFDCYQYLCTETHEDIRKNSWTWSKHTSWVHLLVMLSTSLSFLYAWCWSAWFSNIWILLDWIWVWTLTRSCICFMAFAVCFFTLLLLTTPWSLTKPLNARKLLLACETEDTQIGILTFLNNRYILWEPKSILTHQSTSFERNGIMVS